MAKDTFIFESAKTFSVPEEIADKYLDAPADALRLILFLLRHPSSSFTRDDLCKATGIENNSLDSAFEYWVERNILYRTLQKYTLTRPQIKAIPQTHLWLYRVSVTHESVAFFHFFKLDACVYQNVHLKIIY